MLGHHVFMKEMPVQEGENNLKNSKTLKNIKIMMGDDMVLEKKEKEVFEMPPLTARKIPFQFEIVEPVKEKVGRFHICYLL